MQTALFQLVGNETLAMPLVSLGSLLALRELRRGELVPRRFAFVGATLGAALLAKASAALLLPPLLLALAFEARASASARRAAVASAGALLAATAAISGWHYARMALRYGSPLAANWDAVLGFTWWQDPGYRVAGDYLRGVLGSIENPWWAPFASVPGGLFTTAFGDALFGGQRAPLFAPPWNHRWLACAGALALVPTALIAAGALRAIRRARSDAAWLYLVALAATTALALLAMPLRVPAYTLIKAHFGHAAIVPACAFLALGCEELRTSRVLSAAMGSLLAVWAAVSFAGIWISRDAGTTHAVLAHHALAQRDPERALASFERALAADPRDARFAAGALDALRALRRGSAGLPLCDAPVRELGEANLRSACAAIFGAGGNPERALRELLRARELAPDDLRSASALAKLYLRHGRSDEAESALREWLRIRPHELEAHLALAELALAAGSPERSLAALAPALALDPGNRRAADLLARLRDPRPDPLR
jgi:tetratricopeptide (TPR) repeat protein